ncbi:GyrI-like domain-containing protein [Nocardia testacea]|uniref:GyrI-like domain-containing protein n=1 Tax=Nocardia testacea TaxID=248551 RepID=UPI0002F18FB7|nr:GyrI-like domain-containing protein [Nocardia testacea]
MAYQVDLHESDPHTVLTIRRTVRSDRAGDDIRDGMTDLYRLVRTLGLLPVGPPATTYHGDFRSGAATEVELILPVEAAGTSDGEFTLRRTEPRCYARTCHYGDYADIGTAYRALDEWLRHSGLQAIGPPTEVYRIAPDQAVTPADLLTEIRVPVTSTTLRVRIPRSIPVVVRAVREALRDCDFEILYELPVPAETSRRARAGTTEHLLLGAFDPALAASAARANGRITPLLPCDITVRHADSSTVVETADPRLLVECSGQPALGPAAEQVGERLISVLAAVAHAHE